MTRKQRSGESSICNNLFDRRPFNNIERGSIYRKKKNITPSSIPRWYFARFVAPAARIGQMIEEWKRKNIKNERERNSILIFRNLKRSIRTISDMDHGDTVAGVGTTAGDTVAGAAGEGDMAGAAEVTMVEEAGVGEVITVDATVRVDASVLHTLWSPLSWLFVSIYDFYLNAQSSDSFIISISWHWENFVSWYWIAWYFVCNNKSDAK